MYAGSGKNVPKILMVLDHETSGADWGSLEYAKNYQTVSFGAVFADVQTLTPIKTLYREIKFTPKGPHGDKNWGWSKEAEAIHGLSQAHLEKHGVDMEDAAMDLAEMMLEFFGPTPIVPFVGHNRDFDEAFTRQLFDSINLPLNLHHVHMDTSGTGLLMLGIYKSNELFDFLGLPERKDHNALEDALYTLESCKRMRQLVNIGLGLE